MADTAIAGTTKWARQYETIYILRPNVTTAEGDKVAERVADVIARLNGTITKVDIWGKRKLAYQIKKFSRGIFVYVQFVGFSDLVAELERNLRLLDSVIRYQTIVTADMIDPADVQVDPEETKFVSIEESEDEEEPGMAERLGLTPRADRSESDYGSSDDGMDDDDDSRDDDDDSESGSDDEEE